MLPMFPRIVAMRDRLNKDTIRRVINQKAPMLEGISSHIIHEGSSTSISRADGEMEETEMQQHSASVEIPRMPIDEFFEHHQELLISIAEQFAESRSKQVIEAIRTSSEKTGNIVDAAGEPFSDDLMYQTLEKLAHEFGPNGEWRPPSLILSPAQYEKVIEYDKSRTPEQRAEFDKKLKELIAKKKSEYDSEQAGRILAG